MAAARATLARMRTKLSKGWPSGLTLLTGEDRYHLDAAERELLAVLAPRESSEFALTVFGDAKTDIAAVVTAVRSVGMFSPRRVVLVKDIAALDGDPDVIKAYTTAPPPESYLLVRAPVLDKRRKLHKMLLKGGTTLTFEAPKNEQQMRALIPELTELAAERGLRLQRGSAELMVQAHGGDLYRMIAELDKLRDWMAGDGGAVTEKMIREIGSGGGLIAGWELANAVAAREPARALVEARQLIDSGKEALMIIGGLAWRARIMLQAKTMLEAGVRPDEVYSALQTWGWKKELIKGMREYSLRELLAFPALLLDADRFIKSRSLDARAVLEDLVDKLTRRAAVGSR
jgi:DNA polymerase III delta subunit